MENNHNAIIGSLLDLYWRYTGEHAADIENMPMAGSDRRYFRLIGRHLTCIGTYDPDQREAECFVSLSRSFRKAGCSVPEILAVSDDHRTYLQQDLGDDSLFSMLGGIKSEYWVEKSLEELVRLQQTPSGLWSGHCMSSPFCMRQIMWDLNYFKYEFLKPSGIIFDEDRLEDEFMNIAARLLEIPEKYWGFMMRDCQSRNILIASERPVFIDFQGGRFGPALYDAVSLLWQARACFSPDFRERMLMKYASCYCNGDEREVKEMLSYLGCMILFRQLQVLGAYGFRGLVQHRSHFILSIPGALSNLTQLFSNDESLDFPELFRIISNLSALPRFKREDRLSGLTVEVFSFSYKKGYPVDNSGNGGGFMFDCRAMHNPGRYPQYRSLTGRDGEVIEFLESRGEAGHFLKNAWALTDAAIERYVARGFSNLQIGFGCTGGQHRSVYCAEQTARHIRRMFPEVNVNLVHQEHPE